MACAGRELFPPNVAEKVIRATSEKQHFSFQVVAVRWPCGKLVTPERCHLPVSSGQGVAS